MGSFPQHYPCDNMECDAWTVFTNRPAAGAMRGYGMPQASFADEANVEDCAKAVGMDPLAFRMQNVMPQGYEDGFSHNVNYDDSFRQCLEAGKKYIDYDRKLAEFAKDTGPVRRGIGMVFQSFNLVTRTTVIKNVLSACVPDMPFWRVLLGAFRKADKIKALESLDKVGILDKAYIRADQLSGGQQQRVALARTLTQNPRIILADEPVAALDPVTAKQVMQDFVRINEEMGISILLNIHHVELALEYADRIIGIRAGKIVYDGPSANVDQSVLDAIYGDDSETEADA